MLPHLSMRSLLSQQNAVIRPFSRTGGFFPPRHPEKRLLLTRCGSGYAENAIRAFGTFNHNIAPNRSDPPASEKPLYLNRFDQANDPALFHLEREELERKGMLQLQKTDVVDTADVVQPSVHPHQRKGFLKRMRYWHYHQTAEPTFPRTPDLSKGGTGAFL